MTSNGQTKQQQATEHYAIVREHQFDESHTAIAGSYERMDEMDSAIDWALARNPQYFTNIIDDYYLWKSDKIDGFPACRIVYHVDEVEKRVTLIDIEEVEE